MGISIYKIYNEEIKNIINDSKVTSILLVGSAKNLDLSLDDIQINDIDIFVTTKEGPDQERIIKDINGIEFDINYFSNEGVNKFIENKEYFFLKEMKEAKIIYDKNKDINKIIELCNTEYNKGPKSLTQNEKSFLKMEILSKIERLKQREKYEDFEYKFLINIYLKDIIESFFKINDKWIPKDKKMMSVLKKEEIQLFNFVKKVNENYLYEDLLNVYKYVFENIDISNNIKITY